eukprot:scaffold36338_cov191-Amphora_coffeaeformis.AAC.2
MHHVAMGLFFTSVEWERACPFRVHLSSDACVESFDAIGDVKRSPEHFLTASKTNRRHGAVHAISAVLDQSYGIIILTALIHRVLAI